MRRAQLLAMGATFAAMFLRGGRAHARGIDSRTWRPRDFGAVGDGVADDTLALQRAFDAACNRGGTLFLGPGVYNVRTTLRISTGAKAARIVGTNARIDSSTKPDQPFMEVFEQSADVDVLDISFYRPQQGIYVVYRPVRI